MTARESGTPGPAVGHTPPGSRAHPSPKAGQSVPGSRARTVSEPQSEPQEELEVKAARAPRYQARWTPAFGSLLRSGCRIWSRAFYTWREAIDYAMGAAASDRHLGEVFAKRRGPGWWLQ